jgi:hypothetical protein
MAHNRSTKAQKEYVKTIVHQLSLQRLSDTEIAEYLAKEKGIILARNTINGIKKQIERQAAKWYIELKESRYKYIANYKARLDSLLSYQKKLNQIIDFYLQPPTQLLYPDTIIKAVAELHRIEVSIFNIWKQLPELDIVDKVKQEEEEDGYENTQLPPINDKEQRERFNQWCNEGKPMSRQYRDRMEAKYGVPIEPWDKPPWIQCGWCNRWFKNKWQITIHEDTCIEKLEEPIV